MVPTPSSIYPLHPPGTRVLVPPPSPSSLTATDRALVFLSSLFFVGSVAWVPAVYAYAWRKWRSIPKEDRRRRGLCASLLFGAAAVLIAGPHRSRSVGRWLNFRTWRLWNAWLRFIAFEVVHDSDVSPREERSRCRPSGDRIRNAKEFDRSSDQVIFAVVPHGIFPFSLAFPALGPEEATAAFGLFRPVVATAARLFPFISTFLGWLDAVDASRPKVDLALSGGSRLGVAPGGIAEMFEGYPKPFRHKDDECALLQSRKGLARMAVKHGVPLVPVYVFGATKMLKRLQLPGFESISNLFRIAICLFFGQFGLPIPFRQKLLYVVGSPLFPPVLRGGVEEGSEEFHQHVQDMHKRFCDEIIAIFDRHKDSYGWSRKTLRIV